MVVVVVKGAVVEEGERSAAAAAGAGPQATGARGNGVVKGRAAGEGPVA